MAAAVYFAYKPHSNNDLHNLFGRVGCFPCRLRAPTFPSAVGRHLVHNIRGVVNTTNYLSNQHTVVAVQDLFFLSALLLSPVLVSRNYFAN